MPKWFNRWSTFDSARSLAEWVWWGVCQAFNVTLASLTAYLATYWGWYWQTFNLAGFAVAFLISIIVLPVGAILAAIARDRWLRRSRSVFDIASLSAPPVSSAVTNGGGNTTSFDATAYDPSLYDTRGIKVFRVRVDAQHLTRDFVISIIIEAFNASGRSIWVDEIEGEILFIENILGGPLNIHRLPECLISGKSYRNKELKNLSEFSVVVDQRLPRELVQIAGKLIEAGGRFELDLRKCKILTRDFEDKIFALPIDYGIIIGKNPDASVIGRSFREELEEKISSTENM